MTKRQPSTDIQIDTNDIFALVEKEAGKKFKDHPGARLSEYRKDIPRHWFSTGVPTLDSAMAGGLAGGRASMFYGENNSGKSTLLYAAIAEAQRTHPPGYHDFHVIADPENSSSDAKTHMELLGVDVSKVYIIAPSEGKPMYAEDIFERLEWLFRRPDLHGRMGIVGIDSLGALVSKAEAEKDNRWDKSARVGGIAGQLGRFLEGVVDTGLLQSSGGHLLMLNQVRDNIGDQWNPYRYTGGKKLGHTCAQIVHVSRTLGQDFKNPKYNSQAENSGEAMYIGQKIKFNQEKSKVGGRKGATASINFYYEHGLAYLQNMVDMAKMLNIVQGTTWLSLVDYITGEVIFKAQGINNFMTKLHENETLFKQFEYLLSHVQRGMEVRSVVEEWGDIHMELFGTPPVEAEPEEEDVSEDTEEGVDGTE